MNDDINLQLEAVKSVQAFCQWMIAVQGALLATYARWVTTGAIAPAVGSKTLTFAGTRYLLDSGDPYILWSGMIRFL